MLFCRCSRRAGSSTPDMTARDLPTTDTVDFTTLTEDEGKSLGKTAAVSTSAPKH
jgi:hypothetical protein